MENQKDSKLKLSVVFLLIALGGSIALNFVLYSANHRTDALENEAQAKEKTMPEETVPEETAKPSPSICRLTPYIITQSYNVMRGDKYEARIVLAVDDTTFHPEFFVEGQRLNDRGVYQAVASSIGVKQYGGWVSYIDPISGDSTRKSFSGKYVVSEPAVVISNSELNLLYSGYENKLTISVPGVTNDKLKVVATGASVSRKGAFWIIMPDEKSKVVKITVSAEINGRMMMMGNMDYRVKHLPVPTAYLYAGGKEFSSGANVPIARFEKSELIASYGPDGLLAVPFEISSFVVNVNGKIIQAEGNRFSQPQMEVIMKLMNGSVVMIQDIRAKTPQGTELRLAPIVLTIK
jgi:gliding motility-associated protein GldM